jgi:hypothetical protein
MEEDYEESMSEMMSGYGPGRSSAAKKKEGEEEEEEEPAVYQALEFPFVVQFVWQPSSLAEAEPQADPTAAAVALPAVQ